MVDYESNNTNWDELSSTSDLSESIMEEFSDKLNWLLILFNRKMIKKTIKRFKHQLTLATKHKEFLTKITADKLLNIYIALELNSELSESIFVYVCMKGYNKIVEGILKNYTITPSSINEGFLDAFNNITNIDNSYVATVKIIIEMTDIKFETINESFIAVCMNGYTTIADTFIKKLCREIGKPIGKIGRAEAATIDKGFIIACEYNYVEIVNIILENIGFKVNTVHDEFLRACDDNRTDIVSILIDNICVNSDLNIFNRGFENACSSGNIDILNILIDNQHITPDIIANGFLAACENKQLNVVNNLILNNRITQETYPLLFQTACLEGQSNVVGQLIDNQHITPDIIANGFEFACLKGQGNVVDKLIDNQHIAPYIIRSRFMAECSSNNTNIDILNILIKNRHITPNIIANEFVVAYKNNRTHVVSELLFINYITQETCILMFRTACLDGNIDILNILIENQHITPDIINSGFVFACLNGRNNIVSRLIDNRHITYNSVNDGYKIASETDAKNTDLLNTLRGSRLIAPSIFNGIYSYTCYYYNRFIGN